MWRIQVITDVGSLSTYLGKSDGGYFVQNEDLHREIGGEGAKRLGLAEPDFEKFLRLLNGRDPHTNDQLTAQLIDGRIPGWHITASLPKGVSLAMEGDDKRITDVVWEAFRETMADMQAEAVTNMRGGRDGKKQTGNIVYYAEEHAETRPAKSDAMPDPDHHIHGLIANVTWCEEAKQWQAVQFRNLMDLRKWFDRRFDLRVSTKLANLGYQIDTTYKQGKYYSWDIKGIPETLKAKHSRRSQEVEKLAKELKVETAVGKDKLGATSRLHKREDMTLDDYRSYWNGKASESERKGLAETIKGALKGKNPKQTNTAEKGISFAIGHEFYRDSVIDQKRLEITAMERCMGGAKPEEIIPEALRQGVLLKNGEATTREVLAEEGRIIDFAREGKGTMRPLAGVLSPSEKVATLSPEQQAVIRTSESIDKSGQSVSGSNKHSGLSLNERGTATGRAIPIGVSNGAAPHGRGLNVQKEIATLSAEQQAICDFIHKSTDRVIMIEGDAGTGKTQTMQRTIPGIDKPGVFLAPSASASRGTLREKGFSNADTIARFLVDPKFREGARNGYIYIDEAPLAGISDIDKVFGYAKELNARVILQGDRKQHKSVARGNLFEILDKFAGLPIGRLTENWRQKHKGYKEAVAEIAKGNILAGHGLLEKLGWVKQEQGYDALVDDFLRMGDMGRSVLVVAPSHKAGGAITDAIREKLKEQGKLKDERPFERLIPLHLTPAQKGDRHSYDGTEVLQFTRNSGAYKAGDRVNVADVAGGVGNLRPEHFSVFKREEIRLAAGEAIRITNGGVACDSKGNKHRLDNGNEYTVSGFTKEGDIKLNNGWIVSQRFGHLKHAYVSTSYAVQGATSDYVLAAMGRDSIGAMNAAQDYVTLSRGKFGARIYSDLSPDELRKHIQKTDSKKSASELMNRKPAIHPMDAFYRRRRMMHQQKLLNQRYIDVMKPEVQHSNHRGNRELVRSY